MVAIAAERFGWTDRHEIEAVFDRLVMEVGGARYGDPPYYGVPLPAIGIV